MGTLSTARTTLGLAALLLLSSAGCSSPCRALAEKLCDCRPDTAAREDCLRGVSQRAGAYEASEEQNQVCEGFLDGCDCEQINTADGKRACGLAN
ncbi:MAG TPA: hypothetical protein VEY30_05060 [Myxococcaceae bacterium]|nr:hypothetical protein [Myxococcaceae bacterium]